MDLILLFKTISIAIIAGSLVGIERQYHHKAAGFRTHTLVCMGASIYVLMSNQIEMTGVPMDPSRILGQVVVGVGFLGAGVIMRQGASIQGLNSAATIWCSAALGSMAGLGYYLEAIILSLLIVLINFLGRKVEGLAIFQRKENSGDNSTDL